MFGYIRPVTTELKVKELDAFKACYCGLCHAMGKNYGFLSRFLLNYDFVYLTMLLWDSSEQIEYEKKRCVGCPFRKKSCCKENNALETSAALSVILSWWKIMDEINDNGFFKSLFYRIVSVFLKRGYRKAAQKYPHFDTEVKKYLSELSKLESQKCDSLDAVADCFANILKAAAYSADDVRTRVLEQVLYHTGRWIYIVDACDDYDDDLKTGNYNPVRQRFLGKESIDDEMKDRLRTTLMHSRNLAGNSFELLDESYWSGIIRNIIFLGMPGVAENVFSGNHRKNRIKDWK